VAGRRIGCHRVGDANLRDARAADIAAVKLPRTGLGLLVSALVAVTDTAANAQDQELEQIIVTGSRIARPDFESASPIVTIFQDRFERTGSATVETTLTSLPQFVGSWGSTSNNPSAGGQAQASLRGLNNTATLVLIDGRRMVPSNGYGVPDLNLIPPSLVERVEVLTGGASAVYGSDALAGVVNFRLLDTYEGLEFGGDWAGTGYGDAQAYTANLTGGMNFAEGRGSVMGFVGYSKRNLLTHGDRKFSRVSLSYYGPGTDGVGPHGDFLPQGSSNIEEGRATFNPSQAAFDALFARYGYPAGTVPYQTEFGFNTDGTVFTQGNFDDPGSVANFRGEQDPLTYNDRRYTYNFAPPNALQLPLQRTSVFVNGSFEFSESAELYAQGLYGDYSVDQQLAPTLVPRAYLPPTNPYIAPDLRFLLDSREDPAARVEFSKRILELGPRIGENDYSTYQVTLGLRGKVFSDWQYNAYAQYGQSDQKVLTTGNVSVSKFEELLYAPDGGKATCGGLDPFGLDSISAECARYMAVEMTDKSKVQQWSAEFTLSGSPVTLPAGDVSSVFGLFYKDDSYSQSPDPAAGVILPDGRPDIAGASGGRTAMEGSDHNLDVYVEALVPMLADRPGVVLLQTVLGYRYSDYASAGGTSSYKAELLYQPVDPVRIRGSFQHAVRAPSVFELYEPQLQANPYINPPDPCSVGSEQRTGPNGSAVDALCLAQGIPADVLPTFDYQDEYVEGFYGGNPDLQPEKATTYTVGFVLSSPFSHPALEHAQLSLDWYDISIRDAINVYGTWLFVPNCYNPTFNPEFDVTNQYCSWFGRDLETGVIIDAYEIQRNIASTEVSGIDLQLDWRMSAGPGDVGVTWLVSWMDDYLWKPDPKVKAEQWVNTGCCPTLPEWKWNLDTRYSVGGFTVSAVWTYLGTFHDYFETDFDVPATDYVDLTVAYEYDSGLLDGLTIRAGITNVFDEQPPIFPSSQQANTDPSVFDVIGRRYWVRLNYAIKP
jgi:outer membrane receptor protein involved in Fe transport